MARRSGNWKEYVASRLKDPKMAREYLLAGLEMGEELEAALADLIRAYGVKEFVHDYRVPRATVFRLMAGAQVKMEIYEKLLGRMGMKLTAAPVRPKEKIAA